MICKKCGKENNSENKFCSNCGEQLIDDEKTIVLSKEEIKKEMEKIPVNETEKKEKKSNGLIIILLVLVLFSLIAIIGKQVVDYNSKLDNDINVGNNEDNISDVANELYKKISSPFAELSLISLVLEKKYITTKDIDQELKNYIGYEQIDKEYFIEDKCLNYEEMTDPNKKYRCGQDSSAIDTKEDIMKYTTKYFDENLLKEQVEKVFGKNTYSSVEKISIMPGDSLLYLYNERTKRYVLSSWPGGGTAQFYICKMEKIDKKEDKIIITQSAVPDPNYDLSSVQENPVSIIIQYTFRKNGDNYYFESAQEI